LPDDPVSVAAREALRARLRAVEYYLPLAAFKSDRDVEYVHQLRVASRRALAAVRTFAPLLSERQHKWLSKQLKKIRRAAGGARELDVLGRRIAERLAASPGDARAALVAKIEACRDDAQRPVRKLRAKMLKKDFASRSARIAKRVRWRGEGDEPTFAAAAAVCLRSVAEPFFAASQADATELAALHHFRIAAKHLRYSMETFAAALAPEFRTVLYPAIEEVQTRLGEVNDHAAALEQCEAWLAVWEDGLAVQALREVAESDRQSLEAERARFVRWWTAERAADLRRRFDQALAASATAGEKSA
jgi:CHAD domain-containing protein